MSSQLPSRVAPFTRLLGTVILCGVTLYIFYVAANAFAAAFYNDNFPEALTVKLEALPIIFPIHMISGALALVMIPLTYGLRRRPTHRWVGGATALIVLLSGITAYPVAWIAPVTPWSGAGFMAQATCWLILLGLALWSIYRRRVRDHRYYMLLMAATTSGAVFFRLYLALWAIYGDFRHYRLFYSIDSWIGWTIPLAVAIFLLKGSSPWARNHG